MQEGPEKYFCGWSEEVREMEKTRIAVLAGGWSGEREVSLGSGQAVYDALDRERYDVELYDPSEDLATLIEKRSNIDLAFILLHGKMGEDGCIQGFLDLIGVPYVGSGVLSSSMAMNKKVSKKLFRSAGLRVPRQVILRRGDGAAGRQDVKGLGDRVVVKPVTEGSSLGVSICRSEDQMVAGIERAFLHDDEVMVEEYIAGREITCCVVGTRELEALPLIEIAPNPPYDFFDYDAKYTPGATREICPADLDEAIAERLRECAKIAHRALQCRVWSRTDMILRHGEIYMLETNTIPGMTENSLVPRAARTAGLSLGAFLDRLISLSLEPACPG